MTPIQAQSSGILLNLVKRLRSPSINHILLIVLLATLVVTVATSDSYAVVVLRDRFGDADLDNNGVALEAFDTDINGAGGGTPGDSWEPVQKDVAGVDTDTIFADGVMVNEVTAVENASETGIPWYFTRGFTGSGQPKINAKIIDDTQDNLPDTNPAIGFTSANTGGQVTVAAIDSGYALASESKGRGSSVAGFFDDDYSDGNQGTISLGPEEGDKVKVSFDFRVWMSAPNWNSEALNHIPTHTELRFGLFQDTDTQLGTEHMFAGEGFTPAIWGSEGGQFRGDLAGASGELDHGWFARVSIEDPDETDPNFRPTPDGADARIVEETNDQGGLNNAFLTGPQDNVATPDSLDPMFVNLDYKKVYNLSLTLERFTDPLSTPGAADTIFSTLEVYDPVLDQTFTLGDYEEVGVPGTNDPDGGIESDSWDYFAMASIGNLDEIDWIIDNFQIEVTGSNEPIANADFDMSGLVDGADFLAWQQNAGGAGGLAQGDANGDGNINDADLAIWETQYGGPGGSLASLSTVPEPSALVLLLLGLFGLQLAPAMGPRFSR